MAVRVREAPRDLPARSDCAPADRRKDRQRSGAAAVSRPRRGPPPAVPCAARPARRTRPRHRTAAKDATERPRQAGAAELGWGWATLGCREGTEGPMTRFRRERRQHAHSCLGSALDAGIRSGPGSGAARGQPGRAHCQAPARGSPSQACREDRCQMGGAPSLEIEGAMPDHARRDVRSCDTTASGCGTPSCTPCATSSSTPTATRPATGCSIRRGPMPRSSTWNRAAASMTAPCSSVCRPS